MRSDGPDGFHSWIVAAACCMLYLLMYGMSRISGLLFVETMSLFSVNREDASFPYVFGVTMRYVSGPLSGLLARRIGIRYVVMLGCFMGCIGVGTCVFARNIVALIILWSVIHGYFRDVIGSYIYMFYLMCGISFTCSLLFLCIPTIAKCRNRS
ncbi:unnamed protein product [Larinioides sclopetarius]|uniref:Monocarboxylate transporter n=1 Tax=Larinioides sclopetarius TaxID=280406 RepID=A0AAV2A8Z1_9ARAC